MISVPSTMSAPPGGVWFWQDHDHSFSSPNLEIVAGEVGRVLRAMGDRRDPEQAVFEYMAPRMPRGWATGYTGPARQTLSSAVLNARPYFSRPVDRVDRIMARMDACARCPKRERPFCLTCHGIPQMVYGEFDGRRGPVPQDRFSGVCTCAGTFDMVVASVMYGDGAVWPDTPSTCWRLQR